MHVADKTRLQTISSLTLYIGFTKAFLTLMLQGFAGQASIKLTLLPEENCGFSCADFPVTTNAQQH
jgi:hypothetical protein